MPWFNRLVIPDLMIIAAGNTVSPMDMAMRYVYVNQPEKAMDWLERGFEIHDPTIPYIATRCFNLDTLFGNPRFIDIVKKMKRPLPAPDR